MSSDPRWPGYDSPSHDPRDDLIQDAEVWKFVVGHTQDREKQWFWNFLRCMGFQFTRDGSGRWSLIHDIFPQPPTEEQKEVRELYMMPEKDYIVKTLETLGGVYQSA